MNEFSWLFLVFIALGLTTELWLNLRQKKYVESHMNKVPDAFSSLITLEDHQKAAYYTFEKLRFGNISLVIGALILIAWTLGGGIQYVFEITSVYQFAEVTQGTFFILAVMLLMAIIDIPMSAWNTFVLEEKFGFNRQTPGRFVKDLLLSFTLTIAIGGPVIWVILSIMAQAGSFWWLYAWASWMAFALFMTWAFPTFIAPLFNKFEPLEDGELRELLSALLNRCGFQSNGMFVMDGSKRSSHGNAYFTGFGKNKRIVFFDTLLTQLTPSETEAVLAHELGHFKRKHILKRLVSMAMFTLAGFALLGWLIDQTWFFNGLGVYEQNNAMALLLFVLVAPVFSFFFQPVSAWFSRKHEFEADEFAAEQASGSDLITALVKLYRDNANTLTTDPLYSAFHHSHPPAPVRIAHISSKIKPVPQPT